MRLQYKGDDYDGADYINASYLQVGRARPTPPIVNHPPSHNDAPPSLHQLDAQSRMYIASQAPIPPTFCDFWHMVWEQNVALIVALVAVQKRRVFGRVSSLIIAH